MPAALVPPDLSTAKDTPQDITTAQDKPVDTTSAKDKPHDITVDLAGQVVTYHDLGLDRAKVLVKGAMVDRDGKVTFFAFVILKSPCHFILFISLPIFFFLNQIMQTRN